MRITYRIDCSVTYASALHISESGDASYLSPRDTGAFVILNTYHRCRCLCVESCLQIYSYISIIV